MSSDVAKVFKLLTPVIRPTASSLVDEVNLILKNWYDELSRVYVIFHGNIPSLTHLFF